MIKPCSVTFQLIKLTDYYDLLEKNYIHKKLFIAKKSSLWDEMLAFIKEKKKTSLFKVVRQFEKKYTMEEIRRNWRGLRLAKKIKAEHKYNNKKSDSLELFFEYVEK